MVCCHFYGKQTPASLKHEQKSCGHGVLASVFARDRWRMYGTVPVQQARHSRSYLLLLAVEA